jgi:transcriptional regulator
MAGSDLFTGTLDILILKAVSWGPRHGYAIGRWIRETTSEDVIVQEGALYPALHRLEQKGWLESDWGYTDAGRHARFYRLTTAGRRHLTAQLSRWERYTKAVSLVLAPEPDR